METEPIGSDIENVAVSDNEKPVADGGAGDATTPHAERLKKKNKKYVRSNSKEAVVSPPLPKYRSWKNSRRPRNGHGRGLPKKGGAGGKHVWGAPGSEMLEDFVEDQNDPNYDPESVANGDVEFKQVVVDVDPLDVIRKTEPIVLEYFEHGDTDAACQDLMEFVTPNRAHLTILLTFDMLNSTVDEKLSTFLAELRRCMLVSPEQMDQGFLRVLEDMSDIVLDVPLAYIILDRFVERCSAKFQLGQAVKSKLPSRGRKRYVSEGDGGLIKDHALKLRE